MIAKEFLDRFIEEVSACYEATNEIYRVDEGFNEHVISERINPKDFVIICGYRLFSELRMHYIEKFNDSLTLLSPNSPILFMGIRIIRCEDSYLVQNEHYIITRK